MRNIRFALAVAVAGTVLLAGCAQDTSVPEPQAAAGVSNILPEGKYAEIASAVASALEQADQTRDVGALGDRISGPLRTQREAEYQLAKITQSTSPTSILLNPQEVTVSSGTEFPRTVMAVDTTDTSRGIGTIAVWTQSTARQNYSLWAVVDMFPAPPKIDIVNKQNNDEGYLSENSADYRIDPTTVLDAYATYATNRALGDVPFKEGDPLYEQTQKQEQALTTDLKELGSAKTTFSVPNKDIRAVSTKDGGLVVVGEIRYDTTVSRTKDTAKLKLGSNIGALAEGKQDGVVEVDNPVVAQYSTSVAFYIPPKDSSEPIQLIGASVPALLSVVKAG